MQPNFDPQKPLFICIAEWLEDAILAGVYSEESQIPSITEISVNYNLNPATALKGINLLVDSKLLYKKRGLGMFVASGARTALLDKRKLDFCETYIKPLTSEAKRLLISKEELKTMIERGIENDDKT